CNPRRLPAANNNACLPRDARADWRIVTRAAAGHRRIIPSRQCDFMWTAINDWLTPYRLFWIGAVSLQVVAILRAITRGLGVERTLFWLLAIITLPGVGAVAYFYLGSPSIVRSKVRKQRSTEKIRRARSVPHPSGSHHAY